MKNLKKLFLSTLIFSIFFSQNLVCMEEEATNKNVAEESTSLREYRRSLTIWEVLVYLGFGALISEGLFLTPVQQVASGHNREAGLVPFREPTTPTVYSPILGITPERSDLSQQGWMDFMDLRDDIDERFCLRGKDDYVFIDAPSRFDFPLNDSGDEEGLPLYYQSFEKLAN